LGLKTLDQRHALILNSFDSHHLGYTMDWWNETVLPMFNNKLDPSPFSPPLYPDVPSRAPDFTYPFCHQGIGPQADFSNEPVEVIFAQAPLFSTVPAVGDKGKYLNLFHSAIVLAQGADTTRRYWTLEFDFTGGDILSSIVPQFKFDPFVPGAVKMVWQNDARFCLEDGPKWGVKHWSKRFEVVTTISAVQAKQTFTDLVAGVNNTAPNTKPAYQLWRVAKKWPDAEVLVQDLTCADGALWFLHHIATVHKAIFPPSFQFRATATILNAETIAPVNMKDWKAVDRMAIYFKLMKDMIGAKKPMLERLTDALLLLHDKKKYVYDSNTETYYELSGNKLPFINFEYAHYPLMGPPWGHTNSTSTMIV